MGMIGLLMYRAKHGTAHKADDYLENPCYFEISSLGFVDQLTSFGHIYVHLL